MHTAARSAAPRALHALAAVIAGTLAGAALFRLDGPPPLRAAVLQQVPTSTPSSHPTPTLARSLRPAHFPLALAHARTDSLPPPPTAPPSPTALDATATAVLPATPATPAALPTPGNVVARSQGPPLVYLPALRGLGAGTTCAPDIVVQNVGAEVSKVVLVAWGEPSGCANPPAGPRAVVCSGLMKPGAAWTFDAATLPPGLESGYVVAFNERPVVATPDVEIAIDDDFGDYMCDQLAFGAVHQAAYELEFRRAFLSGMPFDHVLLDRAYGGPIAVQVTRTCPVGAAFASPRAVETSTYTGLDARHVEVAYFIRHSFEPDIYRYALPAIIADSHRTTLIHVQSAAVDDNCLAVFVVLLDATNKQVQCTQWGIRPGESRIIDVAACIAAGGSAAGVAMPTSGVVVGMGGPLAVTVDIAGTAAGWPVLASYTAPSPARPPDLSARIGTTLMAPLSFEPSADGRTGAEIFVQVVGAEQQPAHVRVRFLDRSGDPSAIGEITAILAANGHAAFTVPSPVGAPSTFASVRIDSLPDPARPDVPPPPLAAVVLHSRTTADAFAPGSPLAWSAADTFAAVLDPHTGTPVDATRTTRLALPSVARGQGPTKDAPGRASRMALQNRIDKPGFTDLVVYFYDQNGLLDYICQKLNEQQVEYIDIDTWGYINRGYHGSALVSAWFWEHDVFSPDGFFVANLVDLAAAYGEAGPGDADGRTWTSGVPFSRDFAMGGVVVPLCGGGGPDLRP